MESKKYFFDPQTITSVTDAALKIVVVGQEQKTVTDAVWMDRYKWTPECGIPDWEQRTTILYPYIVYDENGVSVDGVSDAKYKMWYNSLFDKSPVTDYDWRDFVICANGKVHEASVPETECLCYMESNDGIHWTRPDCGEFRYRKQNGEIVGTNIVYISGHGCGVMKNSNPDPNEPRFLMATMEIDSKDSFGGMAINWSDDGIHWEDPITIKTRWSCEEADMELNCDTHNQLFWSDELKRYVCLTRGTTKGIRHVVQIYSLPEMASIRNLTGLKERGGEYWNEIADLWTTPKCSIRGWLGSEPYSIPCTKLSEGYYIGVVGESNFSKEGAGRCYSVHGELAWSKNGVEWQYMDRGCAFIPNAEHFCWEAGNDYGMIFAAAPVEIEDRVEIFYAATPELHYMKYEQIPEKIKMVVDRQIPEAASVRDSQGNIVGAVTRSTALNRITILKDRYAGYCSKEGEICTALFEITGEELKLTADIEPEGSIRIAVCDEDGKLIEGYGWSEFNPICENITEQQLSWQGADGKQIIGKKVYLRLHLKKAIVYALSGSFNWIDS